MSTQIKYVSPKAWKELAKGKNVSSPELANIVVMKSARPLIDVKAIDREKLMIPFIISTADVDRDDDIIAVEGWDLGNYKSNPVVLFAHDHWQPPIARSELTYISDGALRSNAKFTPRELYPFGHMVFEFYANGFMNATSVGFRPKEWVYAEDRKFGVNFAKQELLEYSCVPVPSNPNALMEARAKGIDTNPLKTWCEMRLDTELLDAVSKATLEQVRELANMTGKPALFDLGAMKAQLSQPAPAPSPAPEPKKEEQGPRVLESWGCKLHAAAKTAEERAKHVHGSKAEAERCELNCDVLRVVVRAAWKGKKDAQPTTEFIEKVGRVISAANEDRLRQAMAKGDELAGLIREVLDQLAEQEDEEDDKDFFVFDPEPDDGITEVMMREAIARVLGDELRSQINSLTGRID